ncbi:MAG TPA: glucosyl-3-phosphoglycerate synthase [Solirubrobacteraceae bacterium]|nr:glucosyl-3-phosphoglycerate synthase [Solirubrobacteraceae bacterium]
MDNPAAEREPEHAQQPRTFHHSAYPPQRIAAARGLTGAGPHAKPALDKRDQGAAASSIAGSPSVAGSHGAVGSPSVAVCLPARNCAATVGRVVGALAELREAGVLDELVVIDAGSSDGTASVAVQAGATVYQEAELLPQFGPVLGKGDAMWRGLSVLDSDIVCFLDADTEHFPAHFAAGLIGPLVCDPGVQFVKGFYRRPFEHDGIRLPDGGGRVNHLMARPALARFYPQLSGIRQPLAGEVGARRELLERLPFATGYGVETAMLIDVWRAVGLEAMAQVDLDVHHNPHQSLAALSGMAFTVLDTITRRLERDGRLQRDGRLHGDGRLQPAAGDGGSAALEGAAIVTAHPPQAVERPPLASVRGA